MMNFARQALDARVMFPGSSVNVEDDVLRVIVTLIFLRRKASARTCNGAKDGGAGETDELFICRFYTQGPLLNLLRLQQALLY